MRSIIDRGRCVQPGVGEAAQASADEVAVRIQQIESFEFQLFGLVLVVLVLEGLFVVNPAVLKIQQIMRDMSAVARRAEVLRQEAGAEQQGAPGLRFGRVTRPAGAIAKDPGLQRPTEVPMRRGARRPRTATISTGSRTRRGECTP